MPTLPSPPAHMGVALPGPARASSSPWALGLGLGLGLIGLFLQGCSDPAAPPTPATIVLTPTFASFQDTGQTRTFEAAVSDARGRPLAVPVTWSTTNPGVIAVDSVGLVTSLGEGAAEVVARAGDATGRAEVVVAIADCPAAPLLDLAPGESAVFSAAGSGCPVALPPGTPDSRWRVALYRSSLSSDAADLQTGSLRVTRTGPPRAVGAAPPVTAPASLDAPGERLRSASRLRRSLEVDRATARSHRVMREREARLFRDLGPDATVLPPFPVGERGRVTGVSPAPSPSRRTFLPYTDQCTPAPTPRAAILLAENDFLAVYQDSIQRTSQPVDLQNVEAMLDYYRDFGRPIIDQYFGGVSDVDGNGRVNVFISPAVGDEVAAFVWSGDFFSRTGTGACPASNQMELIYLNGGLLEGMSDETPDYQVLSTLVHEMKHVSSLYKRIRYGTRQGVSSPYHAVWVEEGTAEIAAEVSSRLAWASRGGPPMGARITRQDVQSSGFTPENFGVILRLARTVNYLSSQPNALTVNPVGAGQDYSFYGSSWLFHRFLGDAYGGATVPRADSTLFRIMNDSLSGPAPASYVNHPALARPVQALLQEYVTALLLHAGGRFQGLDFRTYLFGGGMQASVTEIFCAPNPPGIFPWPVTTILITRGECGFGGGTPEVSTPAAPFDDAVFAGPVGPGGLRVHEFVADGGAGVELRGTVGTGGWMVVARTR